MIQLLRKKENISWNSYFQKMFVYRPEVDLLLFTDNNYVGVSIHWK